jgi:hypothetical protein
MGSMRPRAQVAVLIVFGLAAIGAGRFYRDSAGSTPDVFLSDGESLPDVTVHSAEDGKVALSSAIRRDRQLNVVILFSPRCSRCFGEARVWEELAASRTDAAFVVVALAPDFELVQPFINGQIDLPFFIADTLVAQRFRAPGSPTIHIADREKGIVFAAAGFHATNQLRQWLAQ